MDTKNITLDGAAVTSLVHLELEKIGKYEIMDKYDVSDILKANRINLYACSGKVPDSGR